MAKGLEGNSRSPIEELKQNVWRDWEKQRDISEEQAFLSKKKNRTPLKVIHRYIPLT
jgi:hypothetical protein